MRESLRLARGSSLLLSSHASGVCTQLHIHAGIARLSASFTNELADVTMAFAGAGQTYAIPIDVQQPYLLEAISDLHCSLGYNQPALDGEDLVHTWLLEFHRIHHLVGADRRLGQLLRHLTEEFGIRQSNGYLLPFQLGHNRLAELIGSTRSTVTRQLSRWQQQGWIQLIDSSEAMLLSSHFIEVELS